MQLFSKIYKSNIRKLVRLCSDQQVIFQEKDCCGLIILNRPHLLNVLNLNMVTAIRCKLEEWKTKKAFVIIKGSGCKAFCAGADVKSVSVAHNNGDDCYGREFFQNAYQLSYYIKHYPIPYIAIMDGIVMGHGAALSVHGKYSIATERTVFAMPETAIGFLPDAGVAHVLSRLDGEMGMYFALTGNKIEGLDVYRLQLATNCIYSRRLEEFEKCLLECKCPAQLKAIFCEFSIGERDRVSFHHDIDNIDYHFSGDRIEDIFGKLEKDGSQWGLTALFKMKRLSPSSLKIVFQQIRKAACCSLEECLKMDYRLTCRCIVEREFNEGVRALLIEKDKMPKWKPPCIYGVCNHRIAGYFQNLPSDEELDLSQNC